MTETTCEFVKKNGHTCRRRVAAGTFCWQHTKGLRKKWRSLRPAVKVFGIIVLPFMGAAFGWWWQSHVRRGNLEVNVGNEIRANLEHLGTKMQILVNKPGIYIEPPDPNDLAIDRLERARNIGFDTKLYESTLSSSSDIGAAPEITDFYKGLDTAKKFEACVLAIDRGERYPLGRYAWQRTKHVSDLYVTMFVYGSELLSVRLHQSSPSPPSELASEVDKWQGATHAEANEMHISTLQAIKGRLLAWDTTKCEEYKTRLPPV